MHNNPYFIKNKQTKIEVIYLLDILFLLLILFIVYAMNAKPYKSISLNLSHSSFAQTDNKKSLTIDLLKDQVLIEGQHCKQKFSKCLQNKNISKISPILIRASKTIPIQKFIHIFDTLKENQFTNIRLEVEKK